MDFNLTYEIVTEESASQGDAEDRGFLAQKVSLREIQEVMFEYIDDNNLLIDNIETNTNSISDWDWITMYFQPDFDGKSTNLSIHAPNEVSSDRKTVIRNYFVVHFGLKL